MKGSFDPKRVSNQRLRTSCLQAAAARAQAVKMPVSVSWPNSASIAENDKEMSRRGPYSNKTLSTNKLLGRFGVGGRAVLEDHG